MFNEKKYIDNNIIIRDAKLIDAQQLLYWFNNQEDFSNKLLTVNKISFKDHIVWFKNILNNPKSKLFFFEKDNLPIGQVRFESQNELIKISFSVDKKFRGMGYGGKILYLAMKKSTLINKYYIAQVKKHNIYSIKIFRSLNFNEKLNNNIYEFKKKFLFYD